MMKFHQSHHAPRAGGRFWGNGIHGRQSGVGVQFPAAASSEVPSSRLRSPEELLIGMFPENIAKSVAEDQILQVVVFSILFAVVLALVPEMKRRPMLALAESLTATSTGHVYSHKPYHHRQRGNYFKIDEGLDPHASDFLDVGVSSDSNHEGPKQQWCDDHSN
jgi:hypothetical protein